MPAPKILVVPGSIGSDIARLAALAAKELTLADAEVTRISLIDAEQAFDDMDNLRDMQNAELLRAIARRLVDLSRERLGA